MCLFYMYVCVCMCIYIYIYIYEFMLRPSAWVGREVVQLWAVTFTPVPNAQDTLYNTFDHVFV